MQAKLNTDILEKAIQDLELALRARQSEARSYATSIKKQQERIVNISASLEAATKQKAHLKTKAQVVSLEEYGVIRELVATNKKYLEDLNKMIKELQMEEIKSKSNIEELEKALVHMRNSLSNWGKVVPFVTRD
jgi:predicted RNase H-like nuclease (RuvC/YqgF family)